MSIAVVQEPPTRRFAWSSVAMGVPLNIVLYAETGLQAEAAILAAAAEIERCNVVFSDYREDSEVAALARKPAGQWITVSPDMMAVLNRAVEVHQSTEGAFDVTLGGLTRLWRTARRDGRLPSQQELAKQKESSGLGRLEWDWEQRRVRSPFPLSLDFGGIAKGWAADRALEILAQRGMASAFVDLGGDLALGDPPPGRAGWRVAIAPLEKTLLDPQTPVPRYIEVANCGIATSGDTEQYVEIDGVRYSHILDPRTGLGVQRHASVTVIAEDAATADALASAYSVMDSELVKRHAESAEFVRILVQEHIGSGLTEWKQPEFPRLHQTHVEKTPAQKE